MKTKGQLQHFPKLGKFQVLQITNANDPVLSLAQSKNWKHGINHKKLNFKYTHEAVKSKLQSSLRISRPKDVDSAWQTKILNNFASFDSVAAVFPVEKDLSTFL